MTTIQLTSYKSLDHICFEHYGKTAGVVEKVFQANPALSELPILLPPGTRIHLPIVNLTTTNPSIKLWD